MWPSEYRHFVGQHGLVGREIEVSQRDDLSGVGAVIEILDEAQAMLEADHFHPGLIVKANGFVPIGGCGIGTGDSYFINLRDAQPGPVYRIDHEAVSQNGYDQDRAVTRVLDSYELLVKYARN
jgi:hypothetical protein